jgi:hypothetical protein
MSEGYEEDRQSPLTPMNVRKLVAVFALGAAVGLVVWGLTAFFDTYVLRAVLCQGSQTMKCGGSTQYAEAAASIIGAGAGLYFLVRFEVFRPLLVVLATIIGLWGTVESVGLLPWYGAIMATVLLYALAYILFSWLARLRSFSTVIILFIVLIIAVRYTLTL